MIIKRKTIIIYNNILFYISIKTFNINNYNNRNNNNSIINANFKSFICIIENIRLLIFGNISKIIKNENNIILTTEEKLNTNPIYNQNNYTRKNYKTHTFKEDIYYFILY